jgi:hypothetical protein
MYKKVFVVLFIFVTLAACSNTKEGMPDGSQQPENNTQPIHYQPGEHRQVRPTPRNHSMDNDPGRFSDAFTNEESIRISKALEQRRDIVQAQVASTENRVIVSVMLNKQADNHNVPEKIREEIQTIIPDKQIVIYTDDTHWERMKDIDTKLKAKNFGNDILDFFNK